MELQLTRILFLVVLLISIIQKISAQFELTYHYCGKSNYSIPSTFQTNLNTTLSSMASDTGITYGYYNFTAGHKPDKVEAMALCRADLYVNDCRNCVRFMVATLPKTCPKARQAFGYSEYCHLYFTNTSVFHVITTDQPVVVLSNVLNVTDVAKFTTPLTILMTNLMRNASMGNSEIKFATGKTNITSNETLYGMVQCSPDLSTADCVKCVEYLSKKTYSQYFQTIKNQSLFTAKGARVTSPSCSLRYEPYPFNYINSAPQPPLQPPKLPPPISNTAAVQEDVKSSQSHKVIGIIVPTLVGLLVLIMIIAVICLFLMRRKKQRKALDKFNKEDVEELQSLQFNIGVIKVATNNFTDVNKLGHGGFSTVYKGKLPDGQEIVVKRFNRDIVLGDAQFMNEILTLAKLHHRNLVKLVGFCLEDDEMLLIYEFVMNTSLDKFLFHPMHNTSMQWGTRYKIIKGIVRGLLYLHGDSRLRVIHRDLKAANVLLDADFNPKIADFGTAKLFKIDQTQTLTSNVVGTLGYMPPEYLITGQVSLKSDVFSFGVLVLEIVSGQRFSSFKIGENQENLLTFAWKNWIEGDAWSLVDTTLSSASSAEIMRCIHIGLLCVQNNMADRPAMSSVSLMLTSYSMTLQEPSQPAFFTQGNDLDQSDSRIDSKNGITVTDIYPQ